MSQVASIIVLAYGNRPVTERCLETLEEALGHELGRGFELVLVDNDSPDDTAELFASWSDRATVVSMPENRNFSGGCNAGARAASGDVFVFLNNDTEVPAGALEALVEQAREPGVGAVGTRLIYPDGSLQHAGVVHRRIPSGLVQPWHLFHHEAGDLPQACATLELDAVTAACFAIPRAAFERVDGFCESYVNGLEDIDICLRIRSAGLRVVYRGDVAIVHHEGLTRGEHHDESANAEVFARRWQSILDDDGAMVESVLGVRFTLPRRVGYMADNAVGSQLAVAGRLRSPTPEAFEARALIAALDGAGLAPAARPWEPMWEEPIVVGAEWEALERAERRVRSPRAATIVVQAGSVASLPAGSASVARLGAAPQSGAALHVDAVWAASPGLAAELVHGGVHAESVTWLPPAVPDLPLGPGGGGLLALLPAHDPEACRVLLEALAVVDAGPLRLLPNVRSRLLESLVATLAPAAELLQPRGVEAAVAALAVSADVVCGTDGDSFERGPLAAAATGAAVVSVAGGAAAAVLGDGLAVPGWHDRDAVVAALECALADAGARAARAERVRATCGADAMADRLSALVSELEAVRRPRRLLRAPALA